MARRSRPQMDHHMLCIWLLSACAVGIGANHHQDPPAYYANGRDPEFACYSPHNNTARKCTPEFVNVAYGLKIQASNTCGMGGAPSEYCIQTNTQSYLPHLQQRKNGAATSNSLLFGNESSAALLDDDNDDFSMYHHFLSSSSHVSADPMSAETEAPSPYLDMSASTSAKDAGGESNGSPRFSSRCQICHASDPRYAHLPEHLNDFNEQRNVTWWQSETLIHDDIQNPHKVNITLHLGKSFEINYVQVKFHSPRPESFAIYKRTHENAPWTPYQYYSASCMSTYGVQPMQIVHYEHEAVALCTDEFSDIVPLTGASVVFGTLVDRPSAYNYETVGELMEWITATDILISLDRLNTFGDELFRDPQVLKSYYYAISDIAVGAQWVSSSSSFLSSLSLYFAQFDHP